MSKEASVDESRLPDEPRARPRHTLLQGRATLVQGALGLAMLLSFASAANDSLDLRLLDQTVALFTGILWWVWMHRAYRNIEALGHVPAHDAGRVVWAFLVPFANWVWPYQMTAEMWRKSIRFEDTEVDDFMASAPVFLRVWWGLWILRSLSVYATLGPTETSTLVAFAMLDSLAAIAAIYVVRRITERQEGAFAGSTTTGRPQTF